MAETTLESPPAPKIEAAPQAPTAAPNVPKGPSTADQSNRAKRESALDTAVRAAAEKSGKLPPESKADATKPVEAAKPAPAAPKAEKPTETPTKPEAKPEGHFDGISKTLGKETKPGAAPLNPDPKPQTAEEVLKEGEALMADPHLPQRTRQAITRHREQIAEQRKLIESLEKEKLEAKKLIDEAKTKAPTITDEDKAALEEARMLKWEKEIEKDPKIKSEYDDIISAHSDSLIGLLAQHGLSESSQKLIRDMGGFSKLAEADPEFADKIIQNLPLASRLKLQAKLTSIESIQQQKDTFIKQGRAKSKDYFAAKDGQTKAQQEAAQQQRAELKQRVSAWTARVRKEHPVFKPVTIPDNATAEERTRLEQRQQIQKVLDNSLDKIFEGDPQLLAEVINTTLTGVESMLTRAQREAEIIAERDGWKSKFEALAKQNPGAPRSATARREDATPHEEKRETRQFGMPGSSAFDSKTKSLDDKVREIIQKKSTGAID